MKSFAYTQLSSQNLLIDDRADLKEHVGLTAKQVRDDVTLLIYALNRGYGGRKYVDSATMQSSIDSLEFFSTHNQARLSSRDLLEQVDPILFQINDSHLVLRSPRTGLSTYRKLHTRSGKVGVNSNTDPKKAWSVTERVVQTSDSQQVFTLPVLAISTLPAPEDERWHGLSEALDHIVQLQQDGVGVPAMVIDLRGNGGGSDVMGAWLAARLLGQSVISPFDSIMRSQTLESLALAANAWKLKILWSQTEAKPIPEYFRKRLAEKMAEYESARKLTLPEEQRLQMEYPPNKVVRGKYTGQIILLMDADCASSCESLVEFFASVPNALTVGENTAGAVHFGNPGYIVLPNSQLILQIATDYWHYRDGRSLERVGHRPQVQVPEGQDALAFAEQIVRKKVLRAE